MLVLMNPTARNRTAHPDYQGTRLPFAGIKAFWKVLVEADLLPQSLLEDFADRDWNEERTRRVIATLNQEKLYVTNLVKCVSARAADPGAAEINYGLSVLQREIELVQPRYIVAFGLLVFRAITGQTLKLGDYLARLESGETGLESRYYSIALNEINYPVFPCYFPTGRGNSRAATACLRLLNKNLRSIKQC